MSSENAFDDQKAANLARIRDNQRRSRARRKEYLQELEERYRVCEQLGVEASAEMQAAARRVTDENRRLRALLKQHGYTDIAIDRAIYDGSLPVGSTTPVAGLEALFGQRKQPHFAHDGSNSIAHESGTHLAPATTSVPSSSSLAALAAGQASSSAGQMNHIYQQQGAYTDTTLDNARLSGQVSSQHMLPYTPSSHWTSVYPREYGAQHPQVSSSNHLRPQQQHFDVPSLQSIKSEVGYGPQEEIDCQNEDTDYSIPDEQGYDSRKAYH